MSMKLNNCVVILVWQKYQKQFKATLVNLNGTILNQVYGEFTKVHKAVRYWERMGAVRRPIELELKYHLNLQ